MNKIIRTNALNITDKVDVLILTHGDLDGIMSGVILEKWLSSKGKKYKAIYNMATGSGTTDYMYKDNADKLHRDGIVYITDRTFFSYKGTINAVKQNGHHIDYIDHHIVGDIEAENLEYAKTQGIRDNYIISNNHSAALLTYGHIINLDDKFDADSSIFGLARHVSHWDTFKWKELTGLEQDIPKALKAWESMNQMTYIADRFFGVETKDDLVKVLEETSLCKKIYDNNIEELFKYINDNQIGFNTLKTSNPDLGAHIGYILNEKHVKYEYLSDLADNLFERGEKVDFVIWKQENLISIRTSRKSELKANVMAEYISGIFQGTGGGHPNAAGGKLKDNVSFETFCNIMSLLTL